MFLEVPFDGPMLRAARRVVQVRERRQLCERAGRTKRCYGAILCGKIKTIRKKSKDIIQQQNGVEAQGSSSFSSISQPGTRLPTTTIKRNHIMRSVYRCGVRTLGLRHRRAPAAAVRLKELGASKRTSADHISGRIS